MLFDLKKKKTKNPNKRKGSINLKIENRRQTTLLMGEFSW